MNIKLSVQIVVMVKQANNQNSFNMPFYYEGTSFYTMKMLN